MMKFKWSLALLTVIVGICGVSHPISAQTYDDPMPAMRWDDMRNCELVVVGHYESHETSDELRNDPVGSPNVKPDKKQLLILRVSRVLKGQKVNAGDLLPVELRHWYTIETDSPIPQEFPRPPDNIPRLCYRTMYSFRRSLVVPDVSQDALYFFPKAATPTLERPQQVQLTATEHGWKQMLSGQKPDLAFRLLQSVSLQHRRDALEELDASSDSTTLTPVFDWLSVPDTPNMEFYYALYAQNTLISLGDRKNAVYDEASKRLLSMPRNWIPESRMTSQEREKFINDEEKLHQLAVFASYAQIMAEVDNERADRDFEQIVMHGPPALAETIIPALGATQSESALNLALRLLKQPDTSLWGSHLLVALYWPRFSIDDWLITYDSPSGRVAPGKELQAEQFLAKEMPRLIQALHLPIYEESRIREASKTNDRTKIDYDRQTLEEVVEKYKFTHPPLSSPIDLARAQQVLLAPDASTFQYGAALRDANNRPLLAEGIRTIRGIHNVPDVRFVPLLAKVLAKYILTPSELHTNEAANVEIMGAINLHLRLYPHAFRNEIQKLGLPQDFARLSPDIAKNVTQDANLGLDIASLLSDEACVAKLHAETNNSSGLMGEIFDNEALWIRRYTASPTLPGALARSIRADLENKDIGSALVTLRFLLILNRPAGQTALQQTLAQRKTFTLHAQAFVLALGVDNGHTELLPEFLHCFPVPSPASANTKQIDPAIFLLLKAHHPQATERYLKFLDAQVDALLNEDGDVAPSPHSPPNRTPLSILNSDLSERSPVEALFSALAPEHPKEFFGRIAPLLLSSRVPVRAQGENILKNTLHWNLGFKATAFANERRTRLQSIEPLLTRLGDLSEFQMRILLLERRGYKIPQAPQARQHILVQLATNPEQPIAKNALRLLSLSMGDDSLFYLNRVSEPVLSKTYQAMLADRAATTRN